MRVSLSWLREYVALPAGLPMADLDAAFVAAGLEVEEVIDLRDNVAGPLVVGVVSSIEELTEFKKPIRHCYVDVGEEEPRSIICGAQNFAVGDYVVVALPSSVLPGNFVIASRKTYGRLSDGMIASARELGLGEDHSGIMVLSPDVEAAPGHDARPVIGLDEVVFDLAVTPDMAHCFSMRGIAREVAQRLSVPYEDPVSALDDSPVEGQAPYEVRVEDPHGCERFATTVVRGIDPSAESPDWMQQRLVHAGMRPISLAVDIANYLMCEIGQPLHTFDLGTLQGPLVVRRARAGEHLTTLDDVKRKLNGGEMVICDDTGVISLAGVMGGATTEISDATVDVLVEAAYWDPTSIGRTVRHHRIPSEASKRFERGIDKDLCVAVARRAAALLVEYGAGTLDECTGDIDNRRPAPVIRIDPGLPTRIVGVDYDHETVCARLADAGCRCTVADSELEVTPPSWRPDITDPADLVEEVVRMDGYDQVASVMPLAPPGVGLSPSQRRRRHIGRALAAHGYVETANYPFISMDALEALGVPGDDPRRDPMYLANPIVDAEPALRTTLLPGLLKALKTNVDRGQRDVGLFESGVVFLPRDRWQEVELPALPVDRRPTDAELSAVAQLRPHQPQYVAVVVSGQVEKDDWARKGRAADWSDAVAAAHQVASAAGVELTVTQASYAPWHPGRCAQLWCGDRVVGYAGELHPLVCDTLDIPRRTCAMELDVSKLPFPSIVTSPSMSHYPVALLDVAVVVDDDVAAAEVEDALREGAGELLEDIRLFDVYGGERLEAGKKSLAYALSFRAQDRTLTAEESVAAREAAVAAAQQRCGATLRGA